MVEIVLMLCVLCMVFYGAYLLLNISYFIRMKPAHQVSRQELLPSVTIVIPARNEAQWIGGLLDAIQAQTYPREKIQVIVVDDHSDDATADIAKQKMQGWPGWEVIALVKPEGNAYKKAAITQAIERAVGEIIITTDADCLAGNLWVQRMVEAMDADTGLVSGPVQMWDDGGWFQQFQALEFMGLIALGAGSMARGEPNMCNGANLAYRKKVFHAVGGFEGIDHIASGDDELLMHKIHSGSAYKVKFQKCRDAIVSTAPCLTFRQFVNQRIRWVSKSTHYKNYKITLVMSIIYLAILGIPVSILMACVAPEYFWVPLMLFGLKISAESIVLFTATSFFNRSNLMWRFLPEQILHIPYILWAGMAGNLGKYVWKERSVR
jgi:cellulose synthase/poly-beta-1,6-N-acetylglucosamine synthase-like glycosyltransferase